MKSLLLVTTFVVVICLGTGSYIKKRKIIEKKDDYQECSAKEATVFDNFFKFKYKTYIKFKQLIIKINF